MPYDNRRPDRVAEAIREEVATFLADGVKDPRVRGLVTVTGVDVTRDLRHASVWVSVLGDETQRKLSLQGLQSAHGLLQRAVAGQLRLKNTPTLGFSYDDTAERAERLERLLAEADEER